ncbi:hypothetical protein [Vibrio phage vB_VmeM-Yong XC32]|nr:hypothetical protein [Vibrio phage vB_VmeM-Yong XC31]QAX96466.1 hypothetical protein [Vibrio phage vB_VmeM-Yong XC32]QAX96783.1 hypothetical protein [Vibrio phage vB_VmeM-Yong MS31]QAX97102.1 hypothetical protein [Vibrio phage vB_VmeM-Yong MS32]
MNLLRQAIAESLKKQADEEKYLAPEGSMEPELKEDEIATIFAEYEQENADLVDAMHIYAKLEEIEARAGNSSPEMIIYAVNEALVKVPELQLDTVSMESANDELTTEVAMLGLEDVKTKLKDFISGAMKTVKEKMSKIGRAVKDTFRTEYGRAKSMLEVLDQGKGMKDAAVKVSSGYVPYFQVNGKAISLQDGLKRMAASSVYKNHKAITGGFYAAAKDVTFDEAATVGTGVARASRAILEGANAKMVKEVDGVRAGPDITLYVADEGLPNGHKTVFAVKESTQGGEDTTFLAWGRTINDGRKAKKLAGDITLQLGESDARTALKTIMQLSMNNDKQYDEYAKGYWDAISAYWKMIDSNTFNGERALAISRMEKNFFAMAAHLDGFFFAQGSAYKAYVGAIKACMN